MCVGRSVLKMLLAFVVTAVLAPLADSSQMAEKSVKSNSSLTYFDYLWYAYKVQSKCWYKGAKCYANYADNILFGTKNEKVPLFSGVFITKNLEDASERSNGFISDIFKRYNLEVSNFLT